MTLRDRLGQGCDITAGSRELRFYVHMASGWEIVPGSQRGGQNRPLPCAYFVLDRLSCHRPVAVFPAKDQWAQEQRARSVKYHREADACAAGLNLWDETC